MIPALASILLPGAPEPRPPAGGDAQAFALSLDAAGAALGTGGAERQEVAAGGKALPVEAVDAPEIWLPVVATDTEQVEQTLPPVVPAIAPATRPDGHARTVKVRHAPLPQPKWPLNVTLDGSTADERIEPSVEREAQPSRTIAQPPHPAMPDVIRHPAHLSAGEAVSDASGTPAQGRSDEDEGISTAGYEYSLDLPAPSASGVAEPTITSADGPQNTTLQIAREENASPSVVGTGATVHTAGSNPPIRSDQPLAAPIAGSPVSSDIAAITGFHAPTAEPPRSPASHAVAALPASPAQARPETSSVGSAAWIDRTTVQQSPSPQAFHAPTITPVRRDAQPSRAEMSGDKTPTLAPDAPRAYASETVVLSTRPALSGPAAQVFAAELRRGARDGSQPAYEPTTPAISEVRADTIRLDAPQLPLDTHAERWPEAMIERIERLRDAADAADTSIRLSPDALGSVDISVQQDGDAVHVRFEAERAETRALLQDAAPRLAEAAEARGIRLGQTSVGGGDAGSGRQGREPPASSQSSAPAQVRAEAAETSNDTRIA